MRGRLYGCRHVGPRMRPRFRLFHFRAGVVRMPARIRIEELAELALAARYENDLLGPFRLQRIVKGR